MPGPHKHGEVQNTCKTRLLPWKSEIKATSYRCKHCEGETEARKKGTEVAIEPGGREGGVLAKGELEEEEGGAEEGDQDGVDEEEGQPALLHDHHGESPEGVEGGGEGPASEQVVRPAGPQLLILYMVFCCRTHSVGVDFYRLYFSCRCCESC